jgi:glycosyltransferase involved in cell wall biosynthesis
VYNGERYLHHAIQSILDQTLNSFELLVLDDGSDDATASIAKSFQDSRISIIQERRRGLIKTLNRGLELAKGEWIARMDADDICLPTRFEEQIRFINENPRIIALGTAARLIDHEGNDVGRTTSLPSTHKEILKNLLGRCIGKSLLHPSVMMRRSEVINCGGYRESFEAAEDADLWLRLSKNGQLHALSEPLLLLRKHGDNVSQKRRRTQTVSALLAAAGHVHRQTFGVDPVTADRCAWARCVSLVEAAVDALHVFEMQEWRANLVAFIRNPASDGFFTLIRKTAEQPRCVHGLWISRVHRYIIRKAVAELRNTKISTTQDN